jgi:lipoprotein-anchoring transpeptidase ErfK/SrfK
MTSEADSPIPAGEAIRNGYTALARGKRADARLWALRAAQTDPVSEDAWLLLAALASPAIRARYLDHILLIHPDSGRARRALAELSAGLSHPADEGFDDLPAPEQISGSRVPAPITAPLPVNIAAIGSAASAPPPNPKRVSGRTRGMRWGILLAGASCLLALSVTAFANVVAYAQEPPVLARIVRHAGTSTPSFTPSDTPTVTPSFTPTFTLTFTPSPTETPSPTLPPPTAVPYVPPPLPGSGGERWIDVDISSQRVIAYEGNTPVGTFIVSTGTAAHPTVLGRFRIYVKYLYDDMAGPGYYLPNVPYTMYFYEGYGLHGTYWHHNFGTPMSHGCINMWTSDAAWLFSWASVGTVVNIHW